MSSVLPIGEDLPSPRLISNIVSEQEGVTINSFGLSELFIFFGQFIDQDFALSPFEGAGEELDIEVPENDPLLATSSLQFIRSTRALVNDSSSVERPITMLSSALDLSSVYGVDEERNEFLRMPNTCRLYISRDNLLPINTVGFVNSPNTFPAFYWR
ncbi:unnamed protein product [Agarophyton chilense]